MPEPSRSRDNNDRTKDEAAKNRIVEWVASGTPLVGLLGIGIARYFNILSVSAANISAAVLLGLLTVSVTATMTGFLELFRLQQAAFVIVFYPPLETPCVLKDREILLGRQHKEPHKGKLIYPGGFRNPTRDDSLIDTALYLTQHMTGCVVQVASQPLKIYYRRVPNFGVAYRGTVFEAFLIGDKSSLPLNQDAVWMKIGELQISDEVPTIVKKLITEACQKQGRQIKSVSE